MKSRKPKKLLAMFLSLCLVAGMLPMSAFAAETKTCSNHPAHDAACGYIEAVEGHACGHAHDEACGYSEGKEGVPCKHEQGEHDETCGYQEGAGEIPCDKGCSETDEDGAIVHAEGCAYTPAVEGAACSHEKHDESCGFAEADAGTACRHEHDTACGYVEAVEGHACGHTCELCNGTERVILLSETQEATATATPQAAATVPGAPQHFTATTGDKQVSLSWEAPASNGGAEITGYEVSSDGGTTWMEAASNTDHTFDNLTNGQSYTFQVRAVNSAGKGMTAEATATPQAAATGLISCRVKANIDIRPTLSQYLIIGVTLWQDGKQISEGTTNERGTYIFRSLPLGTYTIKTGGRASNGIYYMEQSQIVTVREEDMGSTRSDFTLEPGNAPGTYSISGETNGHKANKKISIVVTLWKEGQKVGEIRSDNNGCYKFTALDPGTYTLKASGWSYTQAGKEDAYYAEYSDTFTIINENIEYSFRLELGNEPDTYSISGSVQEKNDQTDFIPLQFLVVTLWENGQKIGEVKTNDMAEYAFTSLNPGEYTVKAGGWSKNGRGSHYSEQSQVVIIANKNERCSFDLEIGNEPGHYTVSGRVIQGLGVGAITDIPVELWQNGAQVEVKETVLDTTGGGQAARFTFMNLSPGEYTLRIPAGTYGGTYYQECVTKCTVIDADITVIELRQEPGTAPVGYTVSGTIKAATGGGLTGVPVQLLSENIKMSEVVTGADGSFSFPNVNNGAYTLKVYAGVYASTAYRHMTEYITVNGQNLVVGDLELIAAAVPSTPQNFTATPGLRQAVLSWTAPDDDGGSPVIKYQYSATTNGSENWQDIPSSNASTTSYTVTGLTGGTEYTFKVRAVNGAGAGAAATATATPTAPGPSAPQNFDISYANTILILRWKAPASDGGLPIVKYQYSVTKGGEPDNWQDIPGSNASTTTYTVTGLTNLTNYTVKLRAVNSTSIGEAVSDTFYLEPSSPGAVRNLTATPGDGQMTLTWEKPENDGGSPITHYQYRYNVDPNSSGAANQWSRIPDSGPDTVSFTITGLENGVELAFWVRAYSAYGMGDRAMVMATPQAAATVPTAPQNFQATPGDKQAALSWEAPQSTGGAEITGYEVSDDGGTTWRDATSATGHTFENLTNGQRYTFQVRAINSAGKGTAAEATATPQATATVPGEPQNFQATPGNQQVTLSWTAPQSNGGVEITKYEVSSNNGTSWTDATGATSHTFTGLTNGQSYTFKVRAVNSVGNSTAVSTTATPQATATVPGEPQNFQVTPGNQQVALSWTAPQSNGGAEITKYEVSSNNGTSWTDATSATGHTFTGLTNGQSYTFKVRAVNSVGNGTEVSTTATPQAAATVPGEPQNFQATPGDQQVALSWTAPQSNGGAKITKYEVSKDDGTSWTDVTGATSHTFTGLTNDQSYTFKVRAVNSVGNSTAASTTATPQASAYRLTVINGRDITNSGPYREGAQVQIQADTPDTGKTFDRWTGGADNIFPSGRTSATTIITMPAGDVTVSANYKYKSGGGSSNDNNSSSDGNGSSYTAPATQNSYKAEGDKINQSVSPNDLKKLADSGKDLTLNCGKASLIFEPAALKAILAAVPNVEGNITFTAAPVDLSAFPDAAKLIGNRPVYDFTISCKDSMGNNVKANASFPAGSVSIALNYTPASTEVTGSLFIIYVDDKGAVTWLDKSSYNKGRMLSEVPHFSVYGVACKASAPVFTDITNHWAKADIEFVAARGLISGTGNNLYSPDGTMTRGMFVTALGRLAGVSPDSYTTRSFTDVKADAYYAAYVEWAAQKQIANGTGDKLFSPDAPVTREQMAVIMANYAGQMGYSLPAPLAEVTFTDNSKIGAWAAKEVAAMQRAGIIKGKDGGGFDPQASATRAEVSTVLRRFVEIVIDPATANGWIKNDSGHWLYYKDGKTLTGWQVIGNLRYYFNTDGVMHEGWKQDMDTKVWYYWTNDGAATGWRLIDGRWYYFYEDGRMAVSTRIDSYVIGPDGKWKEE